MILKKLFSFDVMSVISLGFFLGCGGKTLPYIPDRVLPIVEDMARIVLTREMQLAGAGSPIYIVDTGGVSFKSQLVYTPEGALLFPESVKGDYVDIRNVHTNSLLICRLKVGETVIWDRTPGIMRLIAIWHDGPDNMVKNIEIESGKTYFLHYTTRFTGDRWEVKEIK